MTAAMLLLLAQAQARLPSSSSAQFFVAASMNLKERSITAFEMFLQYMQIGAYCYLKVFL